MERQWRGGHEGRMRRFIATKANVLALSLIILGFLFILNFLSSQHFVRFDLTEGKRYSLAPSTRRIVSRLDDLVRAEVYFSKKLPPHLQSVKSDVRDMLSELRAYSKGNLEFTFIDPGDDEDLKRKVRMLGVPQVQVNVIEHDKAQVINAYMGMVFLYADKKEAIPVVQDIEDLEYEIMTCLLKLTQDEKKEVGLLVLDKSEKPFEPFSGIVESLEGLYKVTKVSEEEDIPKDLDALVVISPKEVSEKRRFEIDQYIMRGGKVLFLVDQIEMETGTLRATVRKTGIANLLRNLGVEVRKNLVLDRSMARARFSSGFVSFILPYPFWPKALSKNFDKTHPVVRKLEGLVFPWTSSIELVEGEKDLKMRELVKTTEYAWEQEGYFILDPQQRFSPPKERSQKTLVVSITGRPKSLYRKLNPPKEVKEKEVIEVGKKETQIVVCANSRFVTNFFAGQFKQNLVFFMNLVDWLVMGEDLIGIRSRQSLDRPIKDIPDAMKTVLKFGTIFGVPILVVVFGLIRFWMRKRIRQAVGAYYESE
jgi:gliding-associated putative ABC transporter substrate-binding component GldG